MVQRLGYACVGQTFQRVERIPDQASNYTAELVAIKEAMNRAQEGDITIITNFNRIALMKLQ